MAIITHIQNHTDRRSAAQIPHANTDVLTSLPHNWREYGHSPETWSMIYGITGEILDTLCQEALEKGSLSSDYFQTVCGGWLKLSAVVLDDGIFYQVMYMVGESKMLLSRRQALKRAARQMAL